MMTATHAPRRSAEDSQTAGAGMKPIYFGALERPVMGAFHRPVGNWSGTRVVLCAPLGYEGPFAHLALRELAYSLAEQGAAVLRFDYPGYGDSAGSDEPAGQVGRWVQSVHDAIDTVKRLAPSNGLVLLVGMRAGALLACAAAETRNDVAALALWAPSLSGKLFMREHRAFSQMAHVSAAKQGMREGQWGERGFEANGYVFTDDTITEFTKLDVRTMAMASVTDIVLLDRAEAPVGSAFPDAWRRPTTTITEQALSGYADFMEPPWLSARPDGAIQRITEWASALSSSVLPPLPDTAAAEPSSAIVQSNVRETAFWLDHEQEHFGIITEPVGARATHAIVLVTSTFGYRIGPNRMNVVAARHFAALGIATLRLDLSDTGDSRAGKFVPAKAPYDLSALPDVQRAIRTLSERGYRNIALGGICAGAFMAWYAGLMTEGVSQLVLVNPETFRPIEYGVADHRKMLQGSLSWREALRHTRDPLEMARLLTSLVRSAGRIGMEVTAARVPLPRVLAPFSLPARVRRVVRRGAKMSLIFSEEDAGIEELRRQLGPHLDRHQESGHLAMSCIEGADHSFTPRWATHALVIKMAHELERWTRCTATQPQSQSQPRARASVVKTELPRTLTQ